MSGVSGGVSLPAIPGAQNHGSRPSSRADSVSGSPFRHHGHHYTARGATPNAYFSGADIPSFRSTPGRSGGGSNGISRSYAKLPSLRHTSRQSRATTRSDVRSRYSAKFRRSPGPGNRHSADSPFLPKAATEDCLKCLLRTPHKKCESHKYIRVGGGYRHGYWYVKCLLEQIELQRKKELLEMQRLEAIKEKRVKAIKTYIRTKSGRLVERIIFLSEEDYEAFKDGKNVADILKKYLTKEEADGLESWDKDEVVAIKTYVRTKSGRLEERLIYVSKDDYDAIKEGRADANELLKKYVTGAGESVEGWGEAKMKTIKTYVRTKSGRLEERVIMISEDDYNRMIKEGMDPNEILQKYLPLGEGEKLEGWQSGEPMKAIKTMIRTKSGRLIEKTIYISADDYDRMMKEGADPSSILNKYLDPDEQGQIESWEKAPEPGMKVVKTYVRTKSGRLIEKTIMMTEEEFRKFQEAGGDPEFLKKFIKLEEGETIEDWEKASTIYSATDDPDVQKAKAGTRIVGKDGTVYEVVVDPVTGKKYKKKVGHIDSDRDSGFVSLKGGGKGKGKIRVKKDKFGNLIEEVETAEQRSKRKAGKRDADSASDYSYRSVVSAGGTRRVRRRKKRADGTYSDSESYHSSQDEDGAARRRRRRRQRAHGPDSAHSYYSVVSEGGTRHVRRKKKHADGTYSSSESYHSSDSELEGGGLAKKEKKKKRREHGSDSEHSYYSEVSEGGTRRTMRRKRIRDKDGKVVGHGKAEEYESSDGERRKKDKKEEKLREEAAKKKGKSGHEADDESDESEYDPLTGKRKKKGKPGQKTTDGEYEYEYDDQGRVIKKKRIKKGAGDDSGSEYEYEYDEQGNVKAVKKVEKRRGSQDSDDGQYFEVDEKGQLRLKQGKKKIDLSKLTDEDLIRLGIDPSLSKQEIARLLKEKFGADIQITDNKKKIGTRRLSEYGSSVDTDDLADDSDLDISTLKGLRRVNVLMKRGGQALQEHMKKVIDQSGLNEPGEYAKDLDERGDIDFLSHYRLVDHRKLDSYARAFVVEDDDLDTVIGSEETRTALEGVPSVQHMTPKQMEYVLKVLKIDDASQITFRMFAVITAVSERVTQMDPLSKHLLEICDLLDIERKMDLYKSMFYCNVNSDRDSNFIKADSLRIELIAGGLNWKQQQHIMERLRPNFFNEISFLDYICYIPLFLSMHDNIVDNPLDMSDSKYDMLIRKPSGHARQRDMNPLGNPMSLSSTYRLREEAQELLEGKLRLEDIRPKSKQSLVTKYTKLPKLLQDRPPSNASSDMSL